MRAYIIVSLMVAIILQAAPAFAGFAGHNSKGDFGLQSGTQLPPGFYLAPMYYRYDADTVKDSSGNTVSPTPQNPGSVAANAYLLGFIWVSEYKLLGGNYSFQIWPGFTNNNLEVPILGFDDGVSTGFADLYMQPLNLGWNIDVADFTAGVGIFAPTGSYELGGSNNRGLGMWSFELFAGTTVYFDKARSWHLATTAFWETHTDKKSTNIRVGDMLTLEGGLGKSFMDGTLSVGAAYYAQWKLTNDELGINSPLFSGRSVGKNRVYGLGPELTVPIATSEKLYGFLTARYLWEFEAESTSEGETFVLTFTLPIPSIPLQ